jgi:hypothetical protein
MPSSARYKDLGDTWYDHQAARIVQRHILFGQHCRLDLDALLAAIARSIRSTKLRSTVNLPEDLLDAAVVVARHKAESLPTE